METRQPERIIWVNDFHNSEKVIGGELICKANDFA